MPGRSVPIRLSKLFVKVNDEELKNSRIQEAEAIGPVNNSMPATPRGKDIIKQDRARLIDTSQLLEFLSS
jgi:phosphoglycerate-specific signal transduction histidine kinase